jgi:hypothetical protein
MIWLLLLYFIFLIGFAVFSLFGIYQAWRYSFRGNVSKVILVSYVIVSIAIILISLSIISTLQWGSFHFNFNMLNFVNIF